MFFDYLMHRIKTLFVYVNPLRIPYIDLGIASLSAYLKNKGYETKLVDFTFNLNIKEAVNILRKYKPDIVCFTSRSGEFNDVVKTAKIFRRKYKALYICGGIHPTICPGEAISHECFDGICIGEGETALHELITKLKNKQNYYRTKSFWFRVKGKIIKNELNKLISNLDELPLIDYEIFDTNTYLKVRCGQLDYVSARGCPFSCTYCVNHKLMSIYKGLGVYSRRKSAKRIISELKAVKKRFPQIKSLKIADEHFIIDKKRLAELSIIYSKEIGLPFECDVRADFCNEETMSLLKKMGCDKLNIAIESGDEKLRNDLLNKRISDQQIINAFRLARKYKIHTMSFNMVGMPLETKKQICKTIKLNKLIKPDSIQVSIFTPFEGTDLYNFCKENNLLLSDEIESSYYMGEYLKNPYIKNKELGRISRRFTYYCYKDRSTVKAYILLMRDFFVPYYLKYGRYIPKFVRKGIYSIFWNSKILKFVSK